LGLLKPPGDHDSRGLGQPQEEIPMFIFWN